MPLGSLLRIKLISGDLIRDTEYFGKMDPYVQMSTKWGDFWKSEVCDGQGKNPNWSAKLDQFMDCTV